jgi:hypothetical protein
MKEDGREYRGNYLEQRRKKVFLLTSSNQQGRDMSTII